MKRSFFVIIMLTSLAASANPKLMNLWVPVNKSQDNFIGGCSSACEQSGQQLLIDECVTKYHGLPSAAAVVDVSPKHLPFNFVAIGTCEVETQE